MNTSKLYSINWRDVLHGLAVAVGGAVLTTLQEAVTSALVTHTLHLDAATIGTVAMGAGLSYLGKKFFTPEQVITPVGK